MSGWRVAGSLLTLRSQVDALYPGRSKVSDGTIGDAAHQAEVSDHNPDIFGIVRALDLTHDPEHGCDIGQLSDALAAARDPRVSYVIANRLIMSGPGGPSPWIWRNYGGSDPHTNHIHISVVGESIADLTTPWNLPGLGGEVATTNEKIDAMMMGFPSTADGDPVCPTRWQIATENWQRETTQKLATMGTLTVDYVKLAKALLDELAARAGS
jgi:hypothetical protein